MSGRRLTATQIAGILADALEVSDEAKSNLHHRVRYLAKKKYLAGGQELDKRGTVEFPSSEVFRAALFCEFLGLSMDVKVAAAALTRAEELHVASGSHPASARVDGGWLLGSGLTAAIRGVAAGEHWSLVVKQMRSGESTTAGLAAYYTWQGADHENVDHIFNRKKAASVLTIDLFLLFESLTGQLGSN